MSLNRIAEKAVAMLVAALLLPVAPVLASGVAPFTVLTTNSDLQNRKLYAEIMYEQQSCSEYQARFWLEDKSGLRLAVAVDSVLNNTASYVLSQDSMAFMRPKAGGYKLRFTLPKGVKSSDSMRLCVESFELAYRCKGCGVGGSDVIFEPNNVHKNCPYKGSDIVACHTRQGKSGNWEGWIRDARDCKPYRIVLLPDGKWWFAQNLAYTEKIVNSGNANIGLNNASASDNNALFGNYWCTGIPPRGVVQVTATSGLPACGVYGALYTWNSAMRRNGFSSTQDKVQVRDMFSEAQGICPDGWLLPSDFDWGVMLNSVEGCDNTDLFQADGAAPCNHVLAGTSVKNDLGKSALPRLKSTNSCPPHISPVDSICAETAGGAWIWLRLDSKGKLITPHNLGDDYFGFSMLPAGRRHGSGSSSYFTGAGWYAAFWTSSESSTTHAYYRYMDATSCKSGVGVSSTGKFFGLSVRCTKNSTGDDNPRILRLRDVSGVNTEEATFQAYTSIGATVDWYDAPVNGRLLQSGSNTFSTTAPIKVYARARNEANTIFAPSFVSARASFTYSYSGSHYRVQLSPGMYKFSCYGAKGGGDAVKSAKGGMGGMAEGLYEASSKEVAYIFVGGMGKTFNGAGVGGAVDPSQRKGSAEAGATGGGASDIRIGTTNLASRVIVAGGGGGGGGRGHDYSATGFGGAQNTKGQTAIGFSPFDNVSTVWPQGGGGGGGGGYRNGSGGTGGSKFRKGGCRPGQGGKAGGAESKAGAGGGGGESSHMGCAGGGGGGGTHYVGGVSKGTFANSVNAKNGYVIISPQ
ncbi:MAG: hypothetical protein LBT94_00120 [Prevotellaceae bacterium]|jgi:uncharacterized protein (TIGR02145 family)|nr:hypothetical protein [Prevotellaceae bacterium]